TPIAKSWPSEFCLEANKLAIQVLGGYGYTREYPVERFYRDNRLNHIHEGTHAIHGIDLLGRKVRMQGGGALSTLLDEISKAIDAGADNTATATFANDLQYAVVDMIAATEAVLADDDIQRQLANATIYLDAFGHVVIAWMWLLQANAAVKGLSGSSAADTDFYTGKLKAGGFFFRYELPKTKAQFDLVAALDDTCLAAEATHFIGV
ncbi:MAG: acyl-CoA dehydrogenase, partial [Henriciella sp.]|nr:acyl-CoA dehydrogenase [Henriciella sp.]